MKLKWPKDDSKRKQKEKKKKNNAIISINLLHKGNVEKKII